MSAEDGFGNCIPGLPTDVTVWAARMPYASGDRLLVSNEAMTENNLIRYIIRYSIDYLDSGELTDDDGNEREYTRPAEYGGRRQFLDITARLIE